MEEIKAKLWAKIIFNELIVFFLFITAFVYAFPSLKAIQTILEIGLFAYFIIVSFKYKLKKIEFFLVLIFWTVSIISFFINNFDAFLTNIKQFGLAIYSMLYFSRIHYVSKQIFIIALLSLFCMFLNAFIPGLFSSITALTRFADFNDSRFGGIFFNTHFNAYYIAIVFIYLFFNSWKFFPGSIIVYLTGSKFVFISYFFQGIPKKYFKNKMFLIIIIFALVALKFSKLLISIFNTPRLVSLSIILSQLFNIRFYSYLLSFFPNDYVSTLNKITLDSVGLKIAHSYIANEIGYFSLFYQGGNILATIFFIRYLQIAGPFTIFIVFSMFHYGFILSPLMVYIFIVFTKKLENNPKRLVGWI